MECRNPSDCGGAQIAAHYERAASQSRGLVRPGRGAARGEADAEARGARTRANGPVHPAGAERERRELAVLTACRRRSPPDGYASPRLAAAHHRALGLTAVFGPEPPPLLRSLAMAWSRRLRPRRPSAVNCAPRRAADDDRRAVVEGPCLLGFAAFWPATSNRPRAPSPGGGALPPRQQRPPAAVRAGPQGAGAGPAGKHRLVLGDPLARVLSAGPPRAGRPVVTPSPAAALLFAALLDLDMDDEDPVSAHPADLTRWRRRPAGRSCHPGNRGLCRGRRTAAATGPERIRGTLEDSGLRRPPGMRGDLLRIRLAACVGPGTRPRPRRTACWPLARPRSGPLEARRDWPIHRRHNPNRGTLAERRPLTMPM